MPAKAAEDGAAQKAGEARSASERLANIERPQLQDVMSYLDDKEAAGRVGAERWPQLFRKQRW